MEKIPGKRKKTSPRGEGRPIRRSKKVLFDKGFKKEIRGERNSHSDPIASPKKVRPPVEKDLGGPKGKGSLIEKSAKKH